VEETYVEGGRESGNRDQGSSCCAIGAKGVGTSMVRKLLAERNISKDILKTPMIRAWKPSGRVSFKTIGVNFLFFFYHFQSAS
jgi:hypothetical protein